jgi:large subunit ribosomal protein L4
MATTAKVYASDGSAKGSAELPEALFGQPVHDHLLWLSVKRPPGNQRQGTAAVKNRGAVSGGGKKPFRQKGTGRARQGSNTSPLMPGGGRAFGPRPRDYRTELPRRQRRIALTAALSLRAQEDAVSVVETPKLDAPNTATMAKMLATLGLAGKRTLFVVGEHDETTWKSCRNLHGVRTTLAERLNAYELMECEALVLTSDALRRLTEVFVR